jgi:hypothetical protein
VVDREFAIEVAGAEVVEMDLAGRAPGDDLPRPQGAEVGQRVLGHRLGGRQADAELLDAAAVGAPADRRIIQPEHVQDRHHPEGDVGRPHDVAAHVEDVLGAGVGGRAPGVPARLDRPKLRPPREIDEVVVAGRRLLAGQHVVADLRDPHQVVGVQALGADLAAAGAPAARLHEAPGGARGGHVAEQRQDAGGRGARIGGGLGQVRQVRAGLHALAAGRASLQQRRRFGAQVGLLVHRPSPSPSVIPQRHRTRTRPAPGPSPRAPPCLRSDLGLECRQVLLGLVPRIRRRVCRERLPAGLGGARLNLSRRGDGNCRFASSPPRTCSGARGCAMASPLGPSSSIVPSPRASIKTVNGRRRRRTARRRSTMIGRRMPQLQSSAGAPHIAGEQRWLAADSGCLPRDASADLS